MINEDRKLWILKATAIATVLLTILNVVVSPGIRDLQDDVVRRQQYISESAALSRLNTQIIQALATLSAQANDDAIRSLLAKHGVTFTVNAPSKNGEGEPGNSR